MWAPGVSIVTTWEQSEEEEEQEGDDGESDLTGCNLLLVQSQPLTTFGENIWVNGGWKIRSHRPPLSSGQLFSELCLGLSINLGSVPLLGLFLFLFRIIELVCTLLIC